MSGVCVGTIACTLPQVTGIPLHQDDGASTQDVITQQQLLAHIDAETELLILDVRTSAEYASGHIPGAINIPIQDLPQRLDELAEYDVQTPIVIYCERGVRADRGENILQGAGFTAVQHLDGDMNAWRKQERPLEIPSMARNVLQESTSNDPEPSLPVSLASQWIVSPEQAIDLIQQGALLLDAQGKGFGLKRFPGATIVSWQQFSQPESPHRGNLLDDDAQLTQLLQDVGLERDRPVVVFANPPQGWGEDGRIVWMLRTLGHSQSVMVDGGVNALLAAQSQRPESIIVNQVAQGNFVVQQEEQEATGDRLDWAIQKHELQALLKPSLLEGTRSTRSANTPTVDREEQVAEESIQPILIDTREPREYTGATPYGEQRGGHIPGAIHLYFKDLLTEDGYLLPEPELRAKLQTYGITPDRRVIAYCTGGIRSGWLTAVLVSYGYQVENYAGSMWEWSAAPADAYPLIQ